MRYKTLFFGSPDFSAKILSSILDISSIEIVGVVTQPDKPVGRSKELTPTAVKTEAMSRNIPVFHEISPEELEKMNIDICIVFAYGKILDARLLRASKMGFINVHPSRLPLYRGAAPVAYPLFLGDDDTACTLILMDDKMDHGNIIAQTTYAFQKDETQASALPKIAELSIDQIEKAVAAMQNDTLQTQEQDHSKATVTRKIQKEDGYIPLDLIRSALKGESEPSMYPGIINEYYAQNPSAQRSKQSPAEIIMNMYRGMSPWPGIWTIVKAQKEDKRLKLIDLSRANSLLHIASVQLEGKKPVSLAQFEEAYGTLIEEDEAEF